MRLAEKFSRPVIVFVDTPAAYPGIESEERGVAEAIAVNLRDMMVLDTPIIVIVSGEGGSGGALGIAVGDRVLMQEYAIYSVIPPEGCAAILWRDPAKKVEAAEALKMTAPDLLKAGIIDEIIPEPIGGAHTDPAAAAAAVDAALDAGARGGAAALDERDAAGSALRQVPQHGRGSGVDFADDAHVRLAASDRRPSRDRLGPGRIAVRCIRAAHRVPDASQSRAARSRAMRVRG